MDDTGVPVIDGMRVKDGWRSATIRVRGRAEDVFIAPDDRRYVRAAAGEQADLIARVVSARFSQLLVTRLRLEQGSRLVRRARKDERLVQQGEAVSQPHNKETTMKATKKSSKAANGKQAAKAAGPVIRIIEVVNPKTKRKALIRVNAEGQPGAVERKRYGVQRAATWTEVAAKTWAAATKALRAGAGRKATAAK